tara:strand:- start:1657 stop:2058 length:402 start_codon:yes stop_codon:yes gene_type:complete
MVNFEGFGLERSLQEVADQQQDMLNRRREYENGLMMSNKNNAKRLLDDMKDIPCSELKRITKQSHEDYMKEQNAVSDYITLTMRNEPTEVIIAKDKIVYFHKSANGSIVFFSTNASISLNVKETPDEIKRLLG